jgi:outer membrane beta-barrel protein
MICAVDGYSQNKEEKTPVNLSDAANIDREVDEISAAIDRQSEFFTKEGANEPGLVEDETRPDLKGERLDRLSYDNLRSEVYQKQMGVVQRNELVKTGALQFNLSGSINTTDVYYRTVGAQASLHYHLNERYGIGAYGYFLDSSERKEIRNLQDQQSLSISSLIYLRNYYGLNLYINTIYGKMALLNEHVVNYEVFFNLGAGSVSTRNSNNSVGVHAGVGTLVAMDSDSALKFDLNWTFYRAKNVNDVEQSANSMLLSVGYSWFFGQPENLYE